MEAKRRSIIDYFKRVSSFEETIIATTSGRPSFSNESNLKVFDLSGDDEDVVLQPPVVHQANVCPSTSSSSKKCLTTNKPKVSKKQKSQLNSKSIVNSIHFQTINKSNSKKSFLQGSVSPVLISSDSDDKKEDEEDTRQSLESISSSTSGSISLSALISSAETKSDSVADDSEQDDSLDSLWMEEDPNLPMPKVFPQPTVDNQEDDGQEEGDLFQTDSTQIRNVDLSRFVIVEILEQNLDLDSDSGCLETEEDKTNDSTNSVRVWLHFRSLIDQVLQDVHFYYLFDDQDWNCLRAFSALSCTAQQLLVRLLSRKNRWLHRRSIQYEDIALNLDDQLTELCESGFLLNFDYVKDLDTALRLFDIGDLKQFAKKLNGIGSFNTKDRLVDAITKFSQKSRTLSFAGNASLRKVIMKKVRDELSSKCFRLNKQACRLFYRFFLLHYLPGENDEEIGTLLSVQSYNQQAGPPNPFYRIERERRIYKDREHFIQYELACHFEERVIRAKEAKKSTKSNKLIEEMLSIAKIRFFQVIEKYSDFDCNLPPFLVRFTAGHVLSRCLFHLVAILEQRRSYTQTFDILDILLDQKVYAQRYRCKWFERLIVNLEHERNFERAAQVCNIAIISDSVPDSFRYRFLDKLTKLNRRMNRKDTDASTSFKPKKPKNVCTIVGHTIPYRVNDRKNIFYLTDENGEVLIVNVEQVVIHHYVSGKTEEKKFTHGYHCENLFYRSLFAILFWDLLYTDSLPDTFRYVGQYAPLDLESGDFYQRRPEAIEQRLQKLNESHQDEIIRTIESVWTQNKHCVSIANFDHMPLEDFCQAVRFLPLTAIVGICSVLVRDYRFTRSGFPDLLLWNEHTGAIRAVEVKGPGDSLSPKQILWLERLESFGLKAELCHVKSNGMGEPAQASAMEQ